MKCISPIRRYLTYFLKHNVNSRVSCNIKCVTLQTIMTDPTPLGQVKAFARQDAIFLALLWIASFLTMIYFPSLAVGSILALSTPFLVGWRLIRFRDDVLDGDINFGKSYFFSSYTFIYASLLFALFHYLFFRYFDNGAFINYLEYNHRVLQNAYEGSDNTSPALISNIKDSIEEFRRLKPIETALLFMVQNLLIGTFSSLIIAFLCMKRKKKNVI